MVGYSTSTDVAGADNSSDLSLVDVCELLAVQRRQYALRWLIDHGQAVALSDLAEAVAVREHERPLSEIPAETVQTISMSLHHAHLPKLVEAGAVDYEHEQNLVRLSQPTDLIERVLALAVDEGSDDRSN